MGEGIIYLHKMIHVAVMHEGMATSKRESSQDEEPLLELMFSEAKKSGPVRLHN